MTVTKQNGIMDDFPSKREDKDRDPWYAMLKDMVILFLIFAKPNSSKS